MKLYFRNSQAKFRPIANIDGRKPDKEIAKQGKQMTKFDVGSHTEFFYFEKALPFAAFQGDE